MSSCSYFRMQRMLRSASKVFASIQTDGPSESEMPAGIYYTEYSDCPQFPQSGSCERKTNKCVDLNPIGECSNIGKSPFRFCRPLASWQICYANVQRFNYRARQLKYRHMKHKLKRI